jgi:hypothetical protein
MQRVEKVLLSRFFQTAAGRGVRTPGPKKPRVCSRVTARLGYILIFLLDTRLEKLLKECNLAASHTELIGFMLNCVRRWQARPWVGVKETVLWMFTSQPLYM